MKKSLVILTVLAVSVALAGVAMAFAPCGPGGAQVECKYVPTDKKPTKPGCYVIPCQPQVVSVPGSPYAIKEGKKEVPVTEYKTMPVYRDLCKGKAKGVTKLCGPCAPTIKWSCKWQTILKCGEAKIPVPGKKEVPFKEPIPLECKTSVKPPAPMCF